MLRFVRNFNLMDYRQSLEKVIRFKKFWNKLTLRVTFIVDIFFFGTAIIRNCHYVTNFELLNFSPMEYK